MTVSSRRIKWSLTAVNSFGFVRHKLFGTNVNLLHFHISFPFSSKKRDLLVFI